MESEVYKTIHITGSSTTSSDDAIRTAIARAGKTVHNLRWFKVIETRGHIENGQIRHWQVSVELGFTLE
jgi:dodecin